MRHYHLKLKHFGSVIKSLSLDYFLKEVKAEDFDDLYSLNSTKIDSMRTIKGL